MTASSAAIVLYCPSCRHWRACGCPGNDASPLARLRLHEDREYLGRIRQTMEDETHRIGVNAVAIELGVPLSCEAP